MNDAVTLLAETARRGELHHAIILLGPSPELLRAAAMRIAKSLECLEHTTGDDCTACQRVARKIHPDVHGIEVGSERKMISVEQIRDLVTAAAMRPYEGRNKVFIIDPAEAVSAGGSNALLKTLEEPARDTTFILLTRSPDLLLPTIRSRSQSIYVGGEPPRDARLAQEVDGALREFAEKQEGAALLALASTVAAEENVSEAMAVLALALSRAAANGTLPIPRERLLAAAEATIHATRWLAVNADPRLLVEHALSKLGSGL